LHSLQLTFASTGGKFKSVDVRGGRAMDDTAEAVLRYRKLAIDLRATAEGMKDSKNRAMMLSVADRYDQLADAIERVFGSLATH
jgi:hypothetical protein